MQGGLRTLCPPARPTGGAEGEGGTRHLLEGGVLRVVEVPHLRPLLHPQQQQQESPRPPPRIEKFQGAGKTRSPRSPPTRLPAPERIQSAFPEAGHATAGAPSSPAFTSRRPAAPSDGFAPFQGGPQERGAPKPRLAGWLGCRSGHGGGAAAASLSRPGVGGRGKDDHQCALGRKSPSRLLCGGRGRPAGLGRLSPPSEAPRGEEKAAGEEAAACARPARPAPFFAAGALHASQSQAGATSSRPESEPR